MHPLALLWNYNKFLHFAHDSKMNLPVRSFWVINKGDASIVLQLFSSLAITRSSICPMDHDAWSIFMNRNSSPTDSEACHHGWIVVKLHLFLRNGPQHPVLYFGQKACNKKFIHVTLKYRPASYLSHRQTPYMVGPKAANMSIFGELPCMLVIWSTFLISNINRWILW